MSVCEKTACPTDESQTDGVAESVRWRCGRCQVPLEIESVPTRYAHGGLLMQLARCPVCGLTLVPKPLAEGRMVDMQKRMEETWNGV